MKALHCKVKYAINLKPSGTRLDVGDLISLSNLPRSSTFLLYYVPYMGIKGKMIL